MYLYRPLSRFRELRQCRKYPCELVESAQKVTEEAFQRLSETIAEADRQRLAEAFRYKRRNLDRVHRDNS